MDIKQKVAVGALAVLALGGLGAGTALASTPAPAAKTVATQAAVASSPNPQLGGQAGPTTDTPEPGDTPDRPGTAGHNGTDNGGTDAPEPGDTPDSPQSEAAEGPEAPEAGETAGGPDNDNVQHEATGDEGNHADEPASSATAR
ncbi:hypothetical protein [Pseudonocardia hydrocarbonoxydans]|uniref:Uncharacterized protein n=1 Tax=Pseudonocardia hydrocarbonoxydans TaxID=76726 RepID=A0A4Y3WIP3_9PSEU|nr:hypothetical protein [Pseudonocardia hydrocarbonoxydans]GEC18615.1 hypothetical protein PHY01_08980 [Pseudonocardia hydrocarbonoxydans]